MEHIYLDYNATTPLEKSVIDIIHRQLLNWGNPSSNYSLGKAAKTVIEKSRAQIAQMLKTDPSNIIFTSGGTESNNMAIMSGIKQYAKNSSGIVPHVISSSVEHDATLKLLLNLEEKKEIELSLAKPLKGKITVSSILSFINDRTCLITIMMANNETGIVFPVSDIARSLKDINESRKACNLLPVLLHTDAAQVIGKLPVHAEQVGADFISLAGHKFYGPKIGCLYFKKGVVLHPIFYGGGQERGLRPGTENTPMIAGLGEAARLVDENITDYKIHLEKMRNILQKQLQLKFTPENLVLNFIETERLPNTLSISFQSRNGRDILNACDYVIASTGSACHSSNISTSRVIKDCLDQNLWNGTIRLSVGRETTETEIILAVIDIYQAFMKTTSPF